MEVKGFKCFDKNLVNHYGIKFSVGSLFLTSGAIKFGLHGNGFHMCKNLEDTLRYYDTMNDEVRICEVLGGGDIKEYCDEYYGYYDMYAVSRLLITKELTRDEIINYGLNLNNIRVLRFLSGYKLTFEELNLFKNKFQNDVTIQQFIEYYQENKLDAFMKRW